MTKLCAATRSDDKAFFADLLAAPAEWLSAGQVREFWHTIRRTYFQQLEAGSSTTPAQLVADCHARQMQMLALRTDFELHQVPSLFDLEDELRATKAHKATGFDCVPSMVYREAAAPLAALYYGLMIKIWTWQHEPVGHKGGHLTILLKRVQAVLPEHYRGITLLPSFAKRMHALVRRQVIDALTQHRAQGQLGGMPKQQVAYGSHALRTSSRSTMPTAFQRASSF